MGASCNRIPDREIFYVGSFCENACFLGFGGCDASYELESVKTHNTCEFKPELKTKLPINMEAITEAIKNSIGKSIFLYTPDMFSDYYLENCYKLLPDQPKAYISVNACVRTLIDSKVSFVEVFKKGIKEIWLGVESGNRILRDRYSKLPFTNEELIKVTKEAKDAGISICWYLVDGVVDNISTRLETYTLIKEANPFRVHIGELRAYQND